MSEDEEIGAEADVAVNTGYGVANSMILSRKIIEFLATAVDEKAKFMEQVAIHARALGITATPEEMIDALNAFNELADELRALAATHENENDPAFILEKRT